MKQIVQAPLLTPDEKSTLYSNELHRFQLFQNQLQNHLRSQNNLQTQLQSFLTTATKSLEAALKKPRSHEPDSKKQSPSYPPGYSDEGEREHTDDTDVDETDVGKTEREEPDDTDVKESDSGNKGPYEDEDSDHHITIIPRNDPQKV